MKYYETLFAADVMGPYLGLLFAVDVTLNLLGGTCWILAGIFLWYYASKLKIERAGDAVLIVAGLLIGGGLTQYFCALAQFFFVGNWLGSWPAPARVWVLLLAIFASILSKDLLQAWQTLNQAIGLWIFNKTLWIQAISNIISAITHKSLIIIAFIVVIIYNIQIYAQNTFEANRFHALCSSLTSILFAFICHYIAKFFLIHFGQSTKTITISRFFISLYLLAFLPAFAMAITANKGNPNSYLIYIVFSIAGKLSIISMCIPIIKNSLKILTEDIHNYTKIKNEAKK